MIVAFCLQRLAQSESALTLPKSLATLFAYALHDVDPSLGDPKQTAKAASIASLLVVSLSFLSCQQILECSASIISSQSLVSLLQHES